MRRMSLQNQDSIKFFHLKGTTPHAECGAVLARSTKEKREMPHVPQIQTSPFLAT